MDVLDGMRRLALGTAHYTGISSLLRPLTGGVGAILMLHRVTAGPGGALGVNRHLSITPQFFDAVLVELAAMGFRFATMDDLVERLKSPRRGREPLAVLSFDDGYRDNLNEALPILQHHGAPAIVHVAPHMIDRRVLPWWDVLEEVIGRADTIELEIDGARRRINCSSPGRKRRAYAAALRHLTGYIPESGQGEVIGRLAAQAEVDAHAVADRLLMGWDEIAAMARHPLIEIGAHSLAHYNLRRLEPADALHQISAAVDGLADRLGTPPRHMAYPYGHAAAVGQRETELSRRAGLVTAVTTRHGVIRARNGDHLHALPRIALNGRFQQLHHVRPMLAGTTTLMAGTI